MLFHEESTIIPILDKLIAFMNTSLKAKSTLAKLKRLIMNQVFQAQKGTYYGISWLTNTTQPLPSHAPFVSFSEDEVLQQLKTSDFFFIFTIANVFAPRNRSHFE